MVDKSKITSSDVSPEAERVLPEHLPELDPRVAQEVVMTTGFFHVPLLESLLAGIDNAQQHFARRKNVFEKRL